MKSHVLKTLLMSAGLAQTLSFTVLAIDGEDRVAFLEAEMRRLSLQVGTVADPVTGEAMSVGAALHLLLAKQSSKGSSRRKGAVAHSMASSSSGSVPAASSGSVFGSSASSQSS